MKTYLDCLPCFIRQSLEAARLVSDDPEFHEKILRRALAMSSEMDYTQPPPSMARDIHRFIRKLSGVNDPYHMDKASSNDFILSLLPGFQAEVHESGDPFETALRFAVAGNVIDFGVKADLTKSEILSTLDQARTAELDRDTIECFKKSLMDARSVLYIGDNAGEVVFDCLFIETIQEVLGPVNLTFVVRGAPVLNDITMDDALQVGIDKTATRVISNGCDTPGTLLTDCSEEFLEYLEKADVVISKGQGNYETLSELTQETYFLLKAK
ncbi:MAG: ARMT1-like domain-containing protein, partial [Gemmatimonadota bacterium]|nr:ARMT1-like domain-containing protein [Gemmatimonadota bacterium]